MNVEQGAIIVGVICLFFALLSSKICNVKYYIIIFVVPLLISCFVYFAGILFDIVSLKSFEGFMEYVVWAGPFITAFYIAGISGSLFGWIVNKLIRLLISRKPINNKEGS